jgi:hypothetical protein
MLLKKNEKDQLVFQHGKHRLETLEQVAEDDPSYIKWVFNNASEDLPTEVHHALEDVMEKNNIEP